VQGIVSSSKFGVFSLIKFEAKVMGKLSVSIALVLTLGSLVMAPIRANAGVVVAPGTTPDSSGVSGGIFAPPTQVVPPQPAPNTNVSVGGNGTIIAPPAVQNNVNNAAGNIINPPSVSSGQPTQVSIIVIIIQQGPAASAAVTQLQNTFVSFGVPQASVQALVTALRGLVANRSANRSGLPVAQLAPGELVASTKGLATGSVIAQKAETPNVDLNKLNDAIVAFNKIVQESSPETLQKLSQDPEFLKTRETLIKLREALNK
jgi:hypothetical protein